MNNQTDPTLRFSDRVQNYLRYRPHYPSRLIPLLEEIVGLTPETTIADIGSGTGFLTECFLSNGNLVHGVEPNLEMRLAGEEYLGHYQRFRSIDGTAESTTLPSGSVDLIVAGQAFHWFDAARAKLEFRRILVPGGYTALIWNERKLDSTPFLIAYEGLLQEFAVDYRQVVHRTVASNDEATLKEFFAPSSYIRRTIDDHSQLFDLEGLQGRLLSSSYVPTESQTGYEGMIARLHEIFDRYQNDGTVSFDYETIVYAGRLSPQEEHR